MSAGDIPALFNRWRKPIISWLRHRPEIPSADLDDLAQETFIRLLKYSDDVAIENPQGYLFRIASNVANEWQSRFARCKPHIPFDTLGEGWEEIVDRDSPEACLVTEQARIRMRDAVNKLNVRQRTVLLLHVNEGLTYKQIAEREGVTERMVLRDLTGAYSKLRSGWYE